MIIYFYISLRDTTNYPGRAGISHTAERDGVDYNFLIYTSLRDKRLVCHERDSGGERAALVGERTKGEETSLPLPLPSFCLNKKYSRATAVGTTTATDIFRSPAERSKKND